MSQCLDRYEGIKINTTRSGQAAGSLVGERQMKSHHLGHKVVLGISEQNPEASGGSWHSESSILYALFALLERHVSLALGRAHSEKAGLQAATIKGTKARSHQCPRLPGRGSKWGRNQAGSGQKGRGGFSDVDSRRRQKVL